MVSALGEVIISQSVREEDGEVEADRLRAQLAHLDGAEERTRRGL